MFACCWGNSAHDAAHFGGIFRDPHSRPDVISTNTMQPVAAKPHLLSRTAQASALLCLTCPCKQRPDGCEERSAVRVLIRPLQPEASQRLQPDVWRMDVPLRCVGNTAHLAIRVRGSTLPTYLIFLLECSQAVTAELSLAPPSRLQSSILHPRDRVWDATPGLAFARTDSLHHPGRCYFCRFHFTTTAHIGIRSKPDLLSLGYLNENSLSVGPPYYHGCAFKNPAACYPAGKREQPWLP